MTEEEFQQRVRQFIQQLPNYPEVGKRPFGYPRSTWWMSGLWALLGMLLQIPLVFTDNLDRGQVIASVSGAILFGCGFTLRVVAFTTAAGGAVDRWLIEQLQTIQGEDKQNALPRDSNES